MKRLKKVTIYSDGGCRPTNPGPGGYGAVLLYGEHRKELSGGYRLTTNNRMELTAAIAGLEALKAPCDVILYTDSQYLVNAMDNGWAARWQANNWRRSEKEKAKNPDLWERLLTAAERHKVKFIWVKGHAGITENERCDVLATAAAVRQDLPVDEAYEEFLRVQEEEAANSAS